MKTLNNLILPFGKINSKILYIVLFIQLAIITILWSLFNNGIIPSPYKVFVSLMNILSDASFIEDLIESIILTFKAMLISILIASTIAYLSTLPLFYNLAKIVSNLRYLTLTGLIFVFTMITNNAAELKLNLLLFGIIPFFVTSLINVIKSIPKEEFNLCSTLKFSRWRTLYEIVILGRLDQLLLVIRTNFAISWLMITMVEGIAMSEGGVGTRLIKSAKYLNMSDVFAMLFIVYLIGIILDYTFYSLRKWLFPYINI